MNEVVYNINTNAYRTSVIKDALMLLVSSIIFPVIFRTKNTLCGAWYLPHSTSVSYCAVIVVDLAYSHLLLDEWSGIRQQYEHISTFVIKDFLLLLLSFMQWCSEEKGQNTFFSVCNQPPRSTQPGHPFVGRRNEYQPKGGDALRLGSKGRYGSCVGGR